MRYNFLIPDQDPEKIRRAILSAIAHSKEHAHATIWLAMPTVNSLSSTLVSQSLGEKVIRLLGSKKEFTQDGVAVRLVTEATMPNSNTHERAVLFAILPTEKQMMRMNDYAGTPLMIVAPETHPADCEWWCQAYGPKIYSTNRRYQQLEIEDDVVLAGLHYVKRYCVAFTTPDETKILDVFCTLKKHGHDLDPAAVRAWLCRNDVGSKEAKLVSGLADSAKASRKIKNLRKDLYEEVLTKRE